MRCGTNWGWPESPAAPTAALGTGLRRYDGLKRRCFIWRRCRSGGRTFASPSASSIRSSFRRRPESRTHACHRTTRPDRHPAAEASPCAALGTGLRRYDGLKRRCFIWRPCRSGGRTFASPSASSIRSSLPRRPESRTHAHHRTTRPDRHPAAEVPPCAAPGSGLRRYDEASVVALCGACRSTTAGHTKPASKSHPLVIPAQAGIQNPPWVALQMSGAGSGRASRIKRRTG